ncbi:NUDIX hydrolase [Bacillus pseudomycoides]|nr:NUDIX hydrolase [Bacillus pseudomycoides]
MGAAIVENNSLLVVSKKKHPNKYILPGGKPEGNEDELETLSRELDEELNVDLITAEKLGDFITKSVIEIDTLIYSIYLCKIEGNPKPCSEIGDFKWITINDSDENFGSGITQFTIPKLIELGIIKS